MLDWLHHLLSTCVYSFVSNLVQTTTDGHACMDSFLHIYPVILCFLRQSLHCSFNKFTIYFRIYVHIKSTSSLVSFSFWLIIEFTRRARASNIKRCFVACRHSSIEQKHAHDAVSWNNKGKFSQLLCDIKRQLIAFIDLLSTWRSHTHTRISFPKKKIIIIFPFNYQSVCIENDENASGISIFRLSISLTIQ